MTRKSKEFEFDSFIWIPRNDSNNVANVFSRVHCRYKMNRIYFIHDQDANGHILINN